ncbi:MAG: TonB-dependent receptor [Lentisphaerae bacterium]|nr:MAG: TonB-dependent receptor [Lentisphaerota bacterium]
MLRRRLFSCVLCLGLGWGIADSHSGENGTGTAHERDSSQRAPATGTNGANEAPAVIVVSADKVATPVKDSGSSVTVMTGEDLKQRHSPLVLDVLRKVPGLDVVRSGNAGATTYVYIRGAKPEHTLVLIDGVEVNDPISTGRSFDFAHLTTENIERIEIIRGPQSTLYGSDAIGGVINIITRKGKGKPSGYVQGEAGSYGSSRIAIGSSGGDRRLNYSVDVSRFRTAGISSASEDDGNKEKDGYRNTTIASRLEFSPAEAVVFDLSYRYIDGKKDLDNHGGVGGDDPNYTEDIEESFFRSGVKLNLFDDAWEQKLGYGVSVTDRDYRNDPDSAHPNDLLRSRYLGKVFKLDWQHNLYLHETNTLTLGTDIKKEEGYSDYYSESLWGPFRSTFSNRTTRNYGYYVQDQVRIADCWTTTVGGRIDRHSRNGSQSTGRVTSSWRIARTGTRLHGSYGTGFKAPSLYQLYSIYGDENLHAEKSKSWDAGVEQSLGDDGFSVSATWFHNDFDNMIDFDGGLSKYVNIARAETEGWELGFTMKWIRNVDLRFAYTWLRSKDKTTGEPLLRRPDNKYSVDLGYHFTTNGNFHLGVQYVGKRDDNDYSTWPATRVELDDYVLVDMGLSYRLSKGCELFAHVNNLFDKEYEEVKGYGTPGRHFTAGVRLSF